MVPATTVLCSVLLLLPLSECLPRIRIGLSSCPAEAKEPWSYRGKNGPPFWGERYPMCYGKEQSPVAIYSQSAVPDDTLKKLALENYDIPVTSAKVENNGHTVQLTPTDNQDRTISIGGTTYRLAQLHFHWGDVYYRGSEHTLDGVQYAMEMHLVHMSQDGEIAVVGVFLKEEMNNNEELNPFVQLLPELLYKGTSTELKSELNLNGLMPQNPVSYYRYQGSLTTPPCDEGVTWSVAKQLIPVGRNQMAEFRKLYSVKKED
ncbi:Carbonic anhydrase 2, partial [Stegodyphus mimosarum]